MPTSDDPKHYRTLPQLEAEAAKPELLGEAGPAPAPLANPQKPRGAYRVSDEDMRKDPQVLAFLGALRRITDQRKREGLEWLVFELARTKRRGR